MKNADLPAMPVVNGDNEPAEFDRPFYRNSNLATGLTKREMMAMHMMASLVATSGYQMREHIAQDAVAATDALLAELEL